MKIGIILVLLMTAVLAQPPKMIDPKSEELEVLMQKSQDRLKKINILPLIILVSFGIMALYNGLTSTCSVSILFEDYLN